MFVIATIRTSIQIQDNMSRAFQSMNTAMNVVLSSFESLQRASGNAVDTASIQLARQELARAGAAFDQVENEIRQANGEQQRFNNEIRAGTSAADGLLGKLLGIAAAYLSFQSFKGIVGLSDEMTNIKARLDMMNDGLQTTAELQQMIFDSAQRSFGSYADTASLVGKIGMNAADAFSSNTEVIGFAELISKQFGIAGTNAEGVKNATLQLTQALGGGVLRGQELNSIFEHAPNIIQTIADYLDVPIGKIREMAGDGQISSEVIKSAMFSAADGINERFASMPLTFEQLWTSFKNEALWAFQPVLQEINKIANNEKFQNMITSSINALSMLSLVALEVFSGMISVAGFMYDNWGMIEPVIWGVVAALLVYNATMGVAWLTTMRTVAAKLWSVAVSWAETAAIIALTVAQNGLNAALALCPITWIIIGIIAIIAVFYAAVAAVNHFAGTSISATGIVAGVFMVLVTYIHNKVAFLWNVFAAFWEYFANVGKDPVYAAKKLFANLATNVLDQAIAMSSGWDAFATSFVNAMISAVNTAIKAWNWFIDMLPADIAGAIGLGKGTEFEYRASITSDLSHLKDGINDWVGETPSDYWEAPKMDMKSVGGARDVGYDWGASLSSKDPQQGQAGNSFDDLMSGVQSAVSPLTDDGKKTAANTAKMAKSMEGSEEDLKYLRDMAEREVINRFTTAEINVDFKSENTINSDLDLDGIIDQFAEKLEEALDIAAEGA